MLPNSKERIVCVQFGLFLATRNVSKGRHGPSLTLQVSIGVNLQVTDAML